MAQFTLNWDNTELLANANVTAQRASYRRKSVGGAYITTGFSPTNNLAKSAITTNSPVLTDNVIYEFILESLCISNGPTPNDNGVREMIGFGCIVPSMVLGDTTAIVTLDATGTDITKARFTLFLLGNPVKGPIVIIRSIDSIVYNIGGLVQNTSYYLQVELYSTINNIEVISSTVGFIASPCGDYLVHTTVTPVCNPTTSLTVSSTETL